MTKVKIVSRELSFPDLSRTELYILISACVLLIPALLINLGLIPPFFHTDESRRAVVAIEMIFSGDYLSPTINGNLYFNKPPVYNWIIALFFQLTDSFSPFVLRLPTIMGAILLAFFVYRFTLENTAHKRSAWIAALATITTGRILFYDSFIGLIDLTYAAFTFLNFMLIFRYGIRQAWLKLFVISYSIMAFTFLMKGFTALVFQAITLLVFMIDLRKFKVLFSWQHFVGLLSALFILGLYYYLYLNANNLQLQDILNILWNESAKRTPTANGPLLVLKHILLFPFEFIYTFFPWTLLSAFFLIKSIRNAIWKSDFYRFCLLVFFANLIVYWISPGTMPRYLFPILAMLIIPLAGAYSQLSFPSDKIRKYFEFICFALLILVAIASLIMPFIEPTSDIPYGIPVALIISSSLAVLLYFYKNQAPLRAALIILGLVIARIGFDWFILPTRAEKNELLNDDALEVVNITRGQPLYLYRLHTSPEPNTYLHNSFTYVIEANRKEILTLVRTNDNPEAYYLVGDWELRNEEFTTYFKFVSEDVHTIYLVKFN